RELAAALKSTDKPFVLDVRNSFELAIARIYHDQLIPIDELEARLAEVRARKDADIVVLCRSGARSAHATKLLLQAGFERVRNVAGGILAWSDEIDASVSKY
ncbi:MAG: rhodanese-like domain-containing protein, partial [Rhodothermales bacterium]|nr:rhodanese-like domain-containing protein [Rhodothermales bacterium]